MADEYMTQEGCRKLHEERDRKTMSLLRWIIGGLLAIIITIASASTTFVIQQTTTVAKQDVRIDNLEKQYLRIEDKIDSVHDSISDLASMLKKPN